MIRQFALKNSIGEFLDLNSTDMFGYSPSGLGTEFSNAYYGVDANFLMSSLAVNQGQFAINVIFGGETGDTYEKYSEFIYFVNHQPLTLIYQTDSGTYYRDCVVNALPKSEIGEYGAIDEQCVFDFTGPFYTWRDIKSRFELYSDQVNDGKIYQYYSPVVNNSRYAYAPWADASAVTDTSHIGYVYADADLGLDNTIMIDNGSRMLGASQYASCVVTVTGACYYPAWYLYDLNGNLLQADRYFVTLNDGDFLEVCSEPGNQYCAITRADGSKEDAMQYQDFTYTSYVRVPAGETILQFRPNYGNAGIKVRLKEEYLVV